jgi:hypothetical protein
MPPDVDVTTLNQHDASEYRRELIHALRNPGAEFDQVGPDGEADAALYTTKLKEVDAYLLTFDEKI